MVSRVTTMSAVRDWNGPLLLSYGFRPFFLLAGLWAAVAMLIWIAMLTGMIAIQTPFDAFSWHAHEFVFGYTSAVIAGFLLTAVPNWTGRLPVVGWPLAALVALWLAGRVILLWPQPVSALLVAGLDLAFGLTLIFVIAREIVSGKNWRNLPVLGILSLFVAANGLFHWNANIGISANENIGMRIGVAAVIMLISLIGGRIVPSFTRNWLVQHKIKDLPRSVGRFDMISLIVTGVALLAFIILHKSYVTATLCLFAGYFNFVRLSRWQGHRTLAEPLLWVMHAAFGFMALGFLPVALSAADLMPMAGALHVWLVGAIGLMTLAVMTRATRGHTGRELTAPLTTSAIYVLIILSLLARLVAAGLPDFAVAGWSIAALCWILAYAAFVGLYGPMHLGPSAKKIPA